MGVYYPAQYIPADEVLVRVPRQLAQGPLRPVRQSDFAADQEAFADTAYGAAPVGRVKIQTYRGPSKGDYDFAPWDTTTPSLLTSRSTTRANTNNNAIIHPFYHTPVESIPANKKTRIVVFVFLLKKHAPVSVIK